MKTFTILPSIAVLCTAAQGELIWAANFDGASNSNDAGFGNVQTQYSGGSVQNNGPAIPVVDHPVLGHALNITLVQNQERWEAAPGVSDNLGEGAVAYIRVDFVLGDNFPIEQTDPFCLMNQVHQASNSGSPPIEFDVHNNALWVRGASTGYNEELISVERNTAYKLVYGATFSSTASKSLLNVWINGNQVLTNYVPASPLRNGGDSYWKGATMYCDPSIPPLTVFETNHRIGTTYADVN